MAQPATTSAPRAVLYLRQSTAKEESISLELQETAGRDYCTRQGYTVGDVVSDPGITGRTWDRPGVRRAMGMVEQRDAEVIVLWKWSRLSRSRAHWALAVDKVENFGGRIESATEPVDVSTASGRFARGMLAEVAAFESERIGEGWMETHQSRRNRGVPATGGGRYGYRWVRDDGQECYEVDQGEAEVLRWAYQEFIGGAGMPALARGLNRRGITTRNGKAWSHKTIADVLDSGFAAGLLARVVVRDRKKQHTPFADRRWEPASHEAIIDMGTWERYRRERVRRATAPARRTNPTSPLSGLVVCGDCGAHMVRRPNRQWPAFACTRYQQTGEGRPVSASERRIMAKVWEYLDSIAHLLDDPELTAQAEAEVEAERRSKLRSRSDRETAASEVAELDRQLTALTRQLVAGRVSDHVYDQTREGLERDRAAAAERLAMAEEDVDRRPGDRYGHALTLREEWDTLPVYRRQRMLAALIREIRVTPREEGRGRAHVELILR